MGQKQWEYRLRYSVKAEQTLEIHFPTAHRAERILPGKDSESCWEGGGVELVLMCGISIPEQPWDTKNTNRKKKIRETFKIQLFKRKLTAFQMRFPNYIHWFNDLSLKSTLKFTVLLLRD